MPIHSGHENINYRNSATTREKRFVDWSYAIPYRIICVGGAPSSGTTLFADLMDAVPGISCPPELNIFNSAVLYGTNEKTLRKVASTGAMRTKSIYSRKTKFFNQKYLKLFGMSAADLVEMLNSSDKSEAFLTKLLSRFDAEQNRQSELLCEKTPTNALWATQFSTRFPDGLFVHVVRNGNDVVRSLMKRNYSAYEAAMIWMHQVSNGMTARDRKNYLEIRYEDLITNPFEITRKVAKRMGIEVASSTIEESFRDNSFRASLPRPTKWQFAKYTGVVQKHALKDQSIPWLEASSLLRFSPDKPLKVYAHFADLLLQLGYEVNDPSLHRSEKTRLLLTENYRQYLERSKNLDIQKTLRLIVNPKDIVGDIISMDLAATDHIRETLSL